MTPGSLQAADVRGAERADEVGVLADALLDPAPAGVADDVEHGRQALVDAEARHAVADRGAHLLDQLRVEARAPGQRGREGRRLPGGQAGQALLVGDRRDAEPGVGDQPALGLPQRAAPGRRLDRAGAEHPGEVAEPVRRELLELRRRRRRASRPAAARPPRRPRPAPTQRPTIWASFSSSVICASRAQRRGRWARAPDSRAVGRSGQGRRPNIGHGASVTRSCRRSQAARTGQPLTAPCRPPTIRRSAAGRTPAPGSSPAR